MCYIMLYRLCSHRQTSSRCEVAVVHVMPGSRRLSWRRIIDRPINGIGNVCFNLYVEMPPPVSVAGLELCSGILSNFYRSYAHVARDNDVR